MNIPLDAFVELDRLNMTSIIESAGGKFDSAFRLARLTSEIENGSVLDAVWQNNHLLGYLEFQIRGDRISIQSIQIHPDYQNGSILARLLGKAYEQLRNTPVMTVSSSAHQGNIKSLSLHRNLGFDEIARKGDQVRFEISSFRLLDRLSRFQHRIKTQEIS
ncbi:MAG: GNAT family N-acetyltransferase [Pleurocapsa sp. MO_226.B13]|nr:GNAT family N-acetyltransferase [Pleurocapsa sp. MO_226.B13]